MQKICDLHAALEKCDQKQRERYSGAVYTQWKEEKPMPLNLTNHPVNHWSGTLSVRKRNDTGREIIDLLLPVRRLPGISEVLSDAPIQ